MVKVVTLSLILILISACTPSDTATTPEAEATEAVTSDTIATLEPIDDTYQEATQRISSENANLLQSLGQLEVVAGSETTFFDHFISVDGTRLAALNNDLLIEWNLITGQSLFRTSRADALKVFYSPDKDEIYTVNTEGTIIVYESGTGQIKTTLLGHDFFNNVTAYHPERGLLAMGGSDGRIKVWNVAERLSLVTLEPTFAQISALAFDGSGDRIAYSANFNFEAQVWDWENSEQLVALDHIDVDVSDLMLSEDGNTLVTLTPQYVAVWDIETGDLRYNLQSEFPGTPEVFTFSPDGERIAVGGGDSEVLIWDALTGDVTTQLPEVNGDRISGRFSNDSNLFLTTALDRSVSLWNLVNRTDDTVQRATLDIGTRRIVNSGWSDDGFVIVFFDANGTIYVWGIAE